MHLNFAAKITMKFSTNQTEKKFHYLQE